MQGLHIGEPGCMVASTWTEALHLLPLLYLPELQQQWNVSLLAFPNVSAAAGPRLSLDIL